MNELSLFTGAGGGLLGTKLLGWNPIGCVEWHDYCQRVIAARIRDGHLPNAPIFGDIKAFIDSGCAELYRGVADVITGGFPCQDISCAGKGRGIAGEKSGLWKEMAETIRIVRPKYVFLENSPMLVKRGLDVVTSDLARMGYDARWGCFPAHWLGIPQKRKRIYLLAYPMPRDGSLGGNISGSWWEPKHIKTHLDRETKSEPPMVGVVDGLADRLDRLRAIGNGQVPAVVRAAWEILTGGKCTAQQ